MYNFSTSTIINKATDVNGKAYWVAENDEVRVKRVGTFRKGEVVSVVKTEAAPEQVPVTEITVANPTKGDVYRLVINIELNKSESSLYAGPWPTKGKPLYVEAIATDAAAATLAKALSDNASKYMNLVYDTDIVEVSVDGAKLTITGVEGTQVFKSVVLEHWVADDSFAGGKWEEVATGTTVKESNPGFGTYQHLIHNYRIPTLENTRFGGILADETPILEAKYDRFVVRMRVVRDPYGVGAVGQELVSVTDHEFWVNQAVSSAFETALNTLVTAPTILD